MERATHIGKLRPNTFPYRGKYTNILSPQQARIYRSDVEGKERVGKLEED